MKNVAIAMLRDLGMNHDDDCLEFFGRLRISGGWASAAANGTYEGLN